jgi:Serine carboxypeptidase
MPISRLFCFFVAVCVLLFLFLFFHLSPFLFCVCFSVGYIPLKDDKEMFYWLVEGASADVRSDGPLVLWLNGGPGCSSLTGLLTENGPFRPTGTRPVHLVPNEYSWNQVANVVYLESPPPVGFSTWPGHNNFPHGDNATADVNYEFLASWILAYPQYQNRPFYITGESFGGRTYILYSHKLSSSLELCSGGRQFVEESPPIASIPSRSAAVIHFVLDTFSHTFTHELSLSLYRLLSLALDYIPTLSTKLAKNPIAGLDFRGFMVGNPSTIVDHDSGPSLTEYIRTHMLGPLTGFINEDWRIGINPYDILVDTDRHCTFLLDYIRFPHRFNNYTWRPVGEFLEEHSPEFRASAEQARARSTRYVPNPSPCLITDMTEYLRETDVQVALHAIANSSVGAIDWQSCTTLEYVGYSKTIIPYYDYLMNETSISMWIYSGGG